MIRIREQLRHGRRRGSVILLALLSAAVLYAHSAGGMDHHEMSDDGSMSDVVSVCLAVTGLVGMAGVVAAVFGFLVGRPSRIHPTELHRRLDRPRRTTPARARAGPAQLQVFLL